MTKLDFRKFRKFLEKMKTLFGFKFVEFQKNDPYIYFFMEDVQKDKICGWYDPEDYFLLPSIDESKCFERIFSSKVLIDDIIICCKRLESGNTK